MLILNFIVQILIALACFLQVIGIIAGIVFIFVMLSQKDPVKRKLFKKIMIWSFVGPALLLLFILTVWGLIFVLNQTF